MKTLLHGKVTSVSLSGDKRIARIEVIEGIAGWRHFEIESLALELGDQVSIEVNVERASVAHGA